ncbi:MAG TPA: hypothetical protein C5S51_04900 [Methanosarcinaceae archaeon]|nr:hypothetical protein [Methanosarcinaceae archaeon]
MTIYKLAKMHNPLFYFGVLGAILIVIGFGVGLFVVNEWMHDVTRIPMTMLTVLLIIAGFQMFIFGVLSDLIVSLHRETMRAVRVLKDEKE